MTMAAEHYEHSLALRLECRGRAADAIKLTGNELEDRKTQANALQNLWDNK